MENKIELLNLDFFTHIQKVLTFQAGFADLKKTEFKNDPQRIHNFILEESIVTILNSIRNMVGDNTMYTLIAEKGGEKDYSQNQIRSKSKDLISAVAQIKTQLLGNPRIKDSKNIYDELLATKNQLSNQQKSMSEELKKIPEVQSKLREIDNLLQVSCNLINDVFGRLEEQNQELAKKLDDFDTRFFTKFQEFADQQQSLLSTGQQPNNQIAKPQPEEEKSSAKDKLPKVKAEEAIIQGAQHSQPSQEEAKSSGAQDKQSEAEVVGNDERIVQRLQSLSEKTKEARMKRGPFKYGQQPQGLIVADLELKFIQYDDGNMYYGYVRKGDVTREGKGIFIWSNGCVYEGWWSNDQRHGQGREIYDGDVYECEYKNNQRNGYGILTGYDGYTYKGEWLEDKNHGKGVFAFADGNSYEGNYSNNMMHGKGTFTWANGESFESDTWKDGKKNGKGIFTYNNGSKEKHTYDMDKRL